MTYDRNHRVNDDFAGPNRWGDCGELDFSKTISTSIPPGVRERETWMAGKRIDGQKQACAPWRNHPATPYYEDDEYDWLDPDKDAHPEWTWADPTNWADFETVDQHVAQSRELDHRAFVLQREGDPYRESGEADPYLLLDWDDVRNPETGEVLPEVPLLLDRLTGGNLSFAEVSASGGGIHTPLEGKFPDDRKQGFIQLRDDPVFEHDDPPVLEIYEGPHLWWVTGERVRGTPEEIGAVNEDALSDILDEATHAHPKSLAATAEQSRGSTASAEEAHGASASTDSKVTTTTLAPAETATTEPAHPDTLANTLNDETAALALSRVGRALAHIDPDVHYATWLRVGFALCDHFEDKEDAKALFLAWSRGDLQADNKTPAKWDLDAEKKAKQIIQDAASHGDRGVTAGSLFYFAKQAGWEPDEEESVAVLPPSVRDLTPVDSDKKRQALSIGGARSRTFTAIASAYERGDRALIDSLPTGGKSHGAIKAAAATDTPITILTLRGWQEQYEQICKWCDQYDLDYYVLPSFPRDDPTANGSHGDEWQERVMGHYRQGATPKEIHKRVDTPCQGYQGQQCPYKSKWQFEPDNFDVLIGHPAHAYIPKVTIRRTVVVDEFPDGAYETRLEAEQLQPAVSHWLSTHDVPFSDYTDLVENRDTSGFTVDDLDILKPEVDEAHVFDDSEAHAAAPLAVCTLLMSKDLGNGFEVSDLGDTGTGVFNRERGELSILHPPDLTYASAVVALDGTPTKRMWELTLGEELNHRQVLTDGERVEYIEDVLRLDLVRTTEAIKPYNSASHVTIDNDAALLERARDEHGQAPAVVTTATALDAHDDDGALDLERDDTGAFTGEVLDGPVNRVKWYGNVLGSNEFKEKRIGAVIGSNHFGDDYIKKWGAYAGEAVKRVGDGKGNDLSYTGIGDDILIHMREHETLQAAMRFGRDGNGAIVYVHTNTLPDWVPIAGQGRVVNTRSEGMRQVLDAAQDFREWTTAELAGHPTIDIGKRQVLGHLNRLHERGYLSRRKDPDDKRRKLWEDAGLDCVGEYGDVELPEIEPEEVDELARINNYTWEFVNLELPPPSPDPDIPNSAARATKQLSISDF